MSITDKPDAPELIEAVSAFLGEDVLPHLSGRTAFHLKVAINVLGIVAREARDGPQLRDLAARGATELVGSDQEKALAQAIRAGDIPPDDPALKRHLWQTTLAKIAIDQPRYPTYRALMEDGRKPA